MDAGKAFFRRNYMSTINLTRFAKTAGGYKRIDTFALESGETLATALTETAQLAAAEPIKQAWSFSHFNAGRMSGETWKYASAIILEYHLNTKASTSHEERVQEVIGAAERVNLAYYLLDTQTRYGERTLTLVFPLSDSINAARYSRLASVLATQLDIYEASAGIQSHTHLIHLHEGTTVAYRDGLCINPDSFIHLTKDEAQTIDPLQFERLRPAVAAQLEAPTWTACEEGLFSW
jgi:hypothetical protein